MSINAPRTVVAALTLSAAGFVGILQYEGYTDHAVIPVPGDVPTVGFGTTEGVKMGDKIAPPAAVARALTDSAKYQGAIKQCVHVPLHQYEYDAYTSLAYNIGGANFCGSGLVQLLNAGNYTAACAAISDFVCGPADAATAAKPGERCYSKTRPRRVYQGLANRRAKERAMCEGN